VKKKVLNGLMLASVAAVLALNAHVVMSDGDSPILKWDVIGKVLAQSTSGSGSGVIKKAHPNEVKCGTRVCPAGYTWDKYKDDCDGDGEAGCSKKECK
jgi:hypothetical protein